MTKRPNSIEGHNDTDHRGSGALLDVALHYTATIGVLQSERDGFRQRCDTLQTALDHSTAELAATKDEVARLEHVIRQLNPTSPPQGGALVEFGDFGLEFRRNG